MSISPPSDIVLDVARAADPARFQRASERLSRAASASEPFADVLAKSAGTSAPNPPPLAAAGGSLTARRPPEAAEAFRGFEAMALASMIEAALPEEGSAIFGSGTAGQIWKSMLAEELGKEMAEAGGIGIAKQLAASSSLSAAATDGSSQAAARSATETLLVAAIERGFVGDMMTDRTGQDIDSGAWQGPA